MAKVPMPRFGRPIEPEDALEGSGEAEAGGLISYTASLIIQGKHRFFTLSMPSDVLAATCFVDPREEDPEMGFQRVLDRKRAAEIAAYIDSGFGTIPTSIVLSAQVDANLQYRRAIRTLSFRRTPRTFLILDGQHRVYGFRMATSKLRVPVVIYNNLSRTDECRLFIDINTKQRPVPNELLLDIKRLADTETNEEALLKDVFDLFARDQESPLFGLVSPSERARGKISRVTFNAALKAIWPAIAGSAPATVYEALSSYLHACVGALRGHNAVNNITNRTLFRALILLFPTVAERVSDRHDGKYTTAHFDQVLEPFFQRIKRNDLLRPGTSHVALHENFLKALRSGFSISRGT
jgi:DGQHR domain-containing protein